MQVVEDVTVDADEQMLGKSGKGSWVAAWMRDVEPQICCASAENVLCNDRES